MFSFAAPFFLLVLSAASPYVAYRGFMAIRDAVVDKRGITVAARDVADLARAFHTLQVTPSAEKAYYFADDVIRHVDFGRVLSSDLAFEAPNHAKGFTLSGRSIGREFIVDYHKAPLDAVKLFQFLDFGVQTTVAAHHNPMPEEKLGYQVFADAEVLSGELSHREFLRLAGGVLRVLDPVNLQNLGIHPGSPFKHFSPINRHAFDEFYTVLPGLTTFIIRYALLEPHLALRQYHGEEYTDFAIEWKLKLSPLIRDYPIFGAYVENLLDNFAFKSDLVYINMAGLRLGIMTIDSQSKSLKITFKTKNGALLPWSDDQTVHFDKALAIADMKEHEGAIEAAFKGKAKGITINADNIVVSTHYQDAMIARMQAILTRFPAPKISGRAFGFIPTWMIDYSIPGTLEGYGAKLTQMLLRANNGAGTSLGFDVDSSEPRNTQVRMHFQSEILDNFLLAFGLSIIQSYIWPDVDVIKDGFQCVKTGVELLEKDLIRLSNL